MNIRTSCRRRFSLTLVVRCSEAKDASDGVSDELQEVEEELATDKKGDGDPESGDSVGGVGAVKGGRERGLSSPGGVGGGVGGVGPTTSLLTGTSGKVLTGAFTMTFLAEWGDRSQIATIAMAAAKDPYGVTIGGIIGHGLCTGIAVIGGRMLASRISEKAVATVAGFTFLGFAVHSFFYPDVSWGCFCVASSQKARLFLAVLCVAAVAF